ncbi:hypothetical protein SAMN05519104_7777 [Rhizobiales bacterium GAS188]|nr:hypothetical protein SAMN05519104_7777 [Rhizobiales bacterium GAS188]
MLARSRSILCICVTLGVGYTLPNVATARGSRGAPASPRVIRAPSFVPGPRGRLIRPFRNRNYFGYDDGYGGGVAIGPGEYNPEPPQNSLPFNVDSIGRSQPVPNPSPEIIILPNVPRGRNGSAPRVVSGTSVVRKGTAAVDNYWRARRHPARIWYAFTTQSCAAIWAAVPVCNYLLPPPVIYNTPCGVWPYQ